jgi:uncharacterized membrane protein
MSHLNISESILGKHDGDGWTWHLKRNISISPAHMALIFTGLGVLSLTIGGVFYSMGATLVLPFSLVEIAVLLMAYFYNAIHANDYEKLIVGGNLIHIETKLGFKTNHIELVRSMTRVETLTHMNEMVHLRQGTKDTHFGKFVHANLRPLLARKISERLHLG